MLLAIDVGNSHTVLGLFDGPTLNHQWRINTRHDTTADELASLFHGLFNMHGVQLSYVSDVIIASVVPPLQPALNSFVHKYLNKTPITVNTNLYTGMRILTDYPEEVGADRIVNAIAAYARYQTALIVVDFGTAITFDCVSADGDYLGGIITPGIAISLEALAVRTAKLPRVDISSPPHNIIGKNTVDAIKSGILYGFGSMVDGLTQKIAESMKPVVPKIIATGGMASLIKPYAKSIDQIEPLLTLEGLYLLHEKNSV